MKQLPTLDGSTSRTLVLLAALAATTFLTYHGSVDAQAFVAIVSLVLGGVVHASGTKQGSEVSQQPPVDN
jgi:hypothetical protein